LFDQFADPEPLVEFTHPDQVAVRRNARTLEADLERCMKGKLNRLTLCLINLRNVSIALTPS
jgi:hypothetical protein